MWSNENSRQPIQAPHRLKPAHKPHGRHYPLLACTVRTPTYLLRHTPATSPVYSPFSRDNAVATTLPAPVCCTRYLPHGRDDMTSEREGQYLSALFSKDPIGGEIMNRGSSKNPAATFLGTHVHRAGDFLCPRPRFPSIPPGYPRPIPHLLLITSALSKPLRDSLIA